MELIPTFFLSFFLVFLSELGDKTQLLVLSFSTKDRAKNILLGVAVGTFFSHGLAILFGSKLGVLENDTFKAYLEIFTYISFLAFGLIGFLPKKENIKNTSSQKSSFLSKLSNFKISPFIIIAISIIVGELGDKTFLASLGLGINYPNCKISLILGSIMGMVLSNSLALFFGRFLGNKFNPKIINILSNILFIVFGIVGLINSVFF